MKKSINIPLQDQAHTNKHHYVPKHVKINIPLCECTKKSCLCNSKRRSNKTITEGIETKCKKCTSCMWRCPVICRNSKMPLKGLNPYTESINIRKLWTVDNYMSSIREVIISSVHISF